MEQGNFENDQKKSKDHSYLLKDRQVKFSAKSITIITVASGNSVQVLILWNCIC